MKKIGIWTATTIGLVACAGMVSADTIGFNFANDWPSPTISGDTADGFSQWTDSVDEAAPDNGTSVPNSTDLWAITTPVNAPGVTVSWTSANMWQAGSEADPEQGLYRVYLDDGGDSISVSVSGLSVWLANTGYADYSVKLYRSSDSGATGGFTAVDLIDAGTLGVLETLPEIAAGTARGDGNWPTGTGGGGLRDFQQSVGTFTADSITFDPADRNGDIRGNLAGFMITGVNLVPEPSTTILLGLGALVLSLRRRR